MAKPRRTASFDLKRLMQTKANTLILGEKVTLRPFTTDDIKDNYLGWLNDPSLMRFSNQRFFYHDRQSSLRYLQSFDDSPNFFLCVLNQADHRMIGTITAYISPHHGTADIGLMIGEKTVRGRGYGLDAWCALLTWLLDIQGIRKVTAGTLACNAQMLRIIEGSKMQPDGIRKHQEIIGGLPQDIIYFARFRDV